MKTKTKITPVKLLCLALAILFAMAIVIKGVDTSWGSVTVKKASTTTPNGNLMSYKLYIPKSATPETPAPALLYMVGGGSSLDESSTYAIEASRRGYIVIVPDVSGNGMSDPVMNKGSIPISNSTNENLDYAAASIEIVKAMTVYDKSHLALAGHSMGAYYTSIIAQKYPNDVTTVIALGTLGYSGNLANPTTFNYALIIGKGDEAILYRTANARTWSDAINLPAMKQMFGVDKNATIEVGKVYGNYSDKTARVVYKPTTIHMWEPISGEVAKLFFGVLNSSIKAPNDLGNSNFVYGIKEVAWLVAYLDIALLLLAIIQLLLGTKVFSGLILQRESRYIGYKPKSAPWYIATVALAVIIGALLILGWEYSNQLPILKTLGNDGGKCLWSIATAILLLIYIIVFHLTHGRKNHVTLGDYGLATTDSKGFSIKYILKCLAFAFTVFFIVYGIYGFYTTFTNCNIDVVPLLVQLDPMQPTKVIYKFIPVLLFMFTFIFTNAIAQKTIAGSENSTTKEVVFTSLVGTIAFLLVWALWIYELLASGCCMYAPNRGCFGAETLLGLAVSFWLINIACYYLNKKTNSIWTGTITVAVIMTWMSLSVSGMTF